MLNIQLNEEQAAAIEAIKAFLLDDGQDAFVLRGGAGTGKTTLIAKLVTELDRMHLTYDLLAPTGRAARILGNKIRQITGGSEFDASTIHRAIYTLTHLDVNEGAESANDPGLRLTFPLKQEETTVSLFVIDESSMVGDHENHGDFMQFGSGRLLKDIITFARMQRAGRERDHLTKLLFVGDPAQLPPVGATTSPALSDDYLRQEYKLQVRSYDLQTVLRQAKGSAILERATEVRKRLLAGQFNAFSMRPNQQDIREVNATAAVSEIVHGIENRTQSVAVVHSNATAREYNRNVRQCRWGDADLPPRAGDILLVNRNSTTHPLSNGDLIKVVEAAAQRMHVPVHLKGGHKVDLWFREAVVVYRGSDGAAIQTPCMLLENLLDSPFRELTPLEQRALLVDFRKRHPSLHPKSPEFLAAIRCDAFFNALQVKYGYALTCHKAQGGEWDTVIVDFESNAGVRNPQFFRWAYTAITRAAKTLVLVNPPDFSATSDMSWNRPTTVAPSGPAPSLEDLATDPDWQRLSFSAAIAPLMAVHQKLRAVWAAQGIEIEQLQHLQYCERYTLVRDGKTARVQYYYDKKHRLGRVDAAPGAAHDHQLAADALMSLKVLAGQSGATSVDMFIQEFLERLDAAIDGSSISRVGYRAMPYRLRVSFSAGASSGEIDFTYDARNTWTAAQEVGGPGASDGIYEAVQNLLSPVSEASA